MKEKELAVLVNAFLAWPLPDDVCADAVACKPGAPYRTGTNLLTAAQARAMFEHCLALVGADELSDEICLTANQVRELVALAKEGGPVSDSDLTLIERKEFRDEETGEVCPAGLYVFLTEYPEEGFVERLNLYDAEETAAIDALIAAASARPVSGRQG